MIYRNATLFIVCAYLMLAGCSIPEPVTMGLGAAADLVTGDDEPAPLLDLEVETQTGGEQVQGISQKEEITTGDNAQVDTTSIEAEKVITEEITTGDNAQVDTTSAETVTRVAGPVEQVIDARIEGIPPWKYDLAILLGVLGTLSAWLIKRPQTMVQDYQHNRAVKYGDKLKTA